MVNNWIRIWTYQWTRKTNLRNRRGKTFSHCERQMVFGKGEDGIERRGEEKTAKRKTSSGFFSGIFAFSLHKEKK